MRSELEGRPWIRNLGQPAESPYTLAELYHESSKYHRALMVREPLDAQAALAMPRRAEQPGSPLPPPSPDLPLSLGQVLRRRRSVRHFAPAPMPLQVLSDLLFYSAGTTGEEQFMLGDKPWRRGLRTYPSGGALYSVELFILPRTVQGLEPGAWCYNASAHSLVPVTASSEAPTAVTKTAVMPRTVLDLEHAQVVLALVGVFSVEVAKYGRRGYRFALQESGHLAQNAHLAATALGLGSVPTGAFYDEEVNRLLGLDGVRESVLYLIPVGVPAPARGKDPGHG